MISDKSEFLSKIPIFKEINAKDLLLIEKIMIKRHCKKSTLLFSQGDDGEAIYFVISGKVKIFKTSEDGKEHTLTIVVPGDVFAEVVLFNDAPYPASAIIIEDSQIALIRNSDMEKALESNPALAIAVIKALSKRLIESQMQVESLVFQDAKSRTAEALLNLAQIHGKKTQEGIEIEMELSRQELANIVGVTRETLTRTLMSFKKMKILSIAGQRLTLKDFSKLESMKGRILR